MNWGKKDASELGAECGFPKAAEIGLPLHGERADWQAFGWASFFDYPLQIWYVYPFTPLVRGVLRTLGVSPYQLMSQAWGVLWTIDHANNKLGVRFLVEDFVHLQGRQLRCWEVSIVCEGRQGILVMAGVVERHWLDGEFFFVNPASLGPEADFLIEEWKARGIVLV